MLSLNMAFLGVRLRCMTNDFSSVATRHNHKLGGVHQGPGGGHAKGLANTRGDIGSRTNAT